MIFTNVFWNTLQNTISKIKNVPIQVCEFQAIISNLQFFRPLQAMKNARQ